MQTEEYERFNITTSREDGAEICAEFGRCLFDDPTREPAPGDHIGVADQVVSITARELAPGWLAAEFSPRGPGGLAAKLHLRFYRDQPRISNDKQDARVIPASHSPVCPCRLYHDPQVRLRFNLGPLKKSEVRVGVCAVVTHGGALLLTRRSKTLRTFPLKWVCPGGHVNKGETLEEAAIRETKEETGLDIDNLQLFCMWESCSPTYISTGPPSAHHVVLYYKATLALDKFKPGGSHATQLPSIGDFKFQPDEVDAAAWISPSQAADVLAKRNPEHSIPSVYLDRESMEWREGAVGLRALMGVDRTDPVFESIALGTAFVFKTCMGESLSDQ